MKMTSKPWPKRASLSKARKIGSEFFFRACKIGGAVSVRTWKFASATGVRGGAITKDFFARRFNGAAILVTVGAAIVSLSVAAIYRPAGGILWGLFIILAAIDMRR
jgi:hypothetical protein